MEEKSCKTGSHRQTFIMILGCLVPLAILGILWLAGVSQNILSFGIFLLCPILYFVMMKRINHGNIETKAENPDNKEEFT